MSSLNDKVHLAAAGTSQEQEMAEYQQYPQMGGPNPGPPMAHPPAYNGPASVHSSPIQTVVPINDGGQGDQCCGPQEGAWSQGKRYEAEMEEYYMDRPLIPVDQDSVFREPKDGIGFKTLRIYNGYIYKWTKNVMYLLLAGLLGPVLSFAFGLVFGLMQFLAVWVLNPTVKFLHFITRFFNQVTRPVFRSYLDPLFEAMGQFWRVRNSGTFTERKYKVDVSGIEISPQVHASGQIRTA